MSVEHGRADGVQPLRSGQVASAAGVNVQTLRYYERRGLLARPGRNGAGHRQYPPHTVTLLRMIRNARSLGFSLDEIAAVLASDDPAASVESIVERKLTDINARIAELRATRDVLARCASRRS